MSNLTTRFILAKISPLKYLVTFTSIFVGLTIPLLVDAPQYLPVAAVLVLSGVAVVISLWKKNSKWLKHSSFCAMLGWMFASIFATADGDWAAAMWLTIPNIFYFLYIYLFATLKMDIFTRMGD